MTSLASLADALLPHLEVVLEAADELSHWRSLVPQDRQILIDLKADGHSSKEIGDKLGISERTVQRVLEDLRVRIERRRIDHDTAASA